MNESRPASTLLSIPAVPLGSKVAVISPASYPQPDRLASGMAALRALGFEPQLGKYALNKANAYFAGSAEARLADLHAAFGDTEVRAIFCTRGGYGSNYLLPHLDLEKIRQDPKPFLAYSDMTCVQTWLLDRLGLVMFHAPMVAADFASTDGIHTQSLLAALKGDCWSFDAESGLRTLRPGKTTGKLYGGCLTMLAASLSTPYAPETEGKLLFLEDLAVRPYQLDRLLRQLKLAGKFEGVTGVVFGEMLKCVEPGQKPSLLDEVILRVLDDFAGPIAIGLRSGHVSHRNVTLSFGIEAELELIDKPRLTFLEQATHV